jgi:hypothetical protein
MMTLQTMPTVSRNCEDNVSTDCFEFVPSPFPKQSGHGGGQRLLEFLFGFQTRVAQFAGVNAQVNHSIKRKPFAAAVDAALRGIEMGADRRATPDTDRALDDRDRGLTLRAQFRVGPVTFPRCLRTVPPAKGTRRGEQQIDRGG